MANYEDRLQGFHQVVRNVSRISFDVYWRTLVIAMYSIEKDVLLEETNEVLFPEEDLSL